MALLVLTRTTDYRGQTICRRYNGDLLVGVRMTFRGYSRNLTISFSFLPLL